MLFSVFAEQQQSIMLIYLALHNNVNVITMRSALQWDLQTCSLANKEAP